MKTESDQASEPDSDIAGMLELSNWKFKITIIKMLKTLRNKVYSMKEQIGNISREEEILRKKKKEMTEIKNTVT